ncbi:MAG: phasin family protein [Rhodobacteraceae bacterium]|nr:phasin family protein [Paracoccaceae bacterium]
MMTPQDFNKAFTSMMGKMPTEFTAMNDMFKAQAEMGERMSKIVLSAAEQSADISSKWAKESLSKMTAMTKAQKDPADYTKVVTDFASSSAESAAEHMGAFAEVAKKVQMETVELMLAAGKDIQEEATAAMKKATAEVTDTAKKAAKTA